MIDTKILIITGPTAVGKTRLSLELANKYNGEIISADSMQIYKGMDIGTAKISKEKMKDILHYMINIIEPDSEYSLADYQKTVDNIINNVVKNKKLPIMVGGTGLYINAVIDGFMLPEMDKNEDLRSSLFKEAEEYGKLKVYNKLKKIDPELADKLHPNDIRRVIRGIEIYKETGKTKSSFEKKQKERVPRYNVLKIALMRDRQELYTRINKRVDKMIKNGLIDEVQDLMNKYNLSKTARQALGYKEIINYLNGERKLSEAIRIIKRDTRHYAKRQLSFLRRDEDIIWYNLSNISYQMLLNNISELINDFIEK